MRILLIQLRQLGDILLTTPSVRAVREAFPNAKIDFLAHRMGKLILDDLPDLNELVTYTEADGLSQNVALIKRLRQARYDLVIDFMNNPRSSLLTLLSKGKRRIAFTSARRWFYTDTTERPSSGDYIVREKFELLEAAGIPARDEQLLLPWSRTNADVTVEFAKQHPEFLQAPYRVVISPTHRRAARQWPLDRYAEVANHLVDDWGAFVTWAWGPGEEPVADECVQLTRASTKKMPKATFREMAAFVSNQDLFVGNSNGPSHVAVASDICSLQLHGPTRASSWCPMNEKHQAIESPFPFQDTRRDMQSITTARVIEGLAQMKQSIERQAMRRIDRPLRLHWSGDAS